MLEKSLQDIFIALLDQSMKGRMLILALKIIC